MTTTRIIGLTGNIGSGKSTIGRIFSQYGWPVFDSDAAGRLVLDARSAEFSDIIALFGEKILDVSGQIDRQKLGAIVFGHPQKIAQLNAIVHPAVARLFDRWVLRQPSAFVVRETALLYETGIYKTSWKNIVVSCPLEERIRRVMARNQLDRASVLDREQKQMPEAEKIKQADYVIENFEKAVIPQVMQVIRQLEQDALRVSPVVS